MAMLSLAALIVAAMAGLAVGRRRALVPILVAAGPVGVATGATLGAVVAFAAAAFGLGAHMHRVVQEETPG
jgi:ribosome biogenesis protein Tsr3